MKTQCSGRIPKNVNGNRGVCIQCGREGFINAKGRLYPHSREMTEAEKTVVDEPHLTEYDPVYRDVTLKLTACVDCGALIANKNVHDQWHEAVLHDLKRLNDIIDNS